MTTISHLKKLTNLKIRGLLFKQKRVSNRVEQKYLPSQPWHSMIDYLFTQIQEPEYQDYKLDFRVYC
ncbi:hypothetical protein BC008_23745 [Mastigocoleus testarum BC008]|uniref:Uncharacterized protein n=1 Tax=Mastigocoleus testarum BC008 TaxID=371196 RepID=A0A0V7ZNI4_9CYAN|nr:hypothetical protein BC008_23745 [Mastigocoleus testarum BC008]